MKHTRVRAATPPVSPSPEEAAPAAGRVVARSWDTFDEMAASIHDARLRAFITSRPSRRWSLDAWAMGRSLLQRGVEGAAVSGAGSLAPGRVAFFLTGERSASRRCNGEELDAERAFRWGPGSEISSISRRPSDWLALTVTEETMRRTGAVLEEEQEVGKTLDSRPANASPAAVHAFRKLLAGAMRAMDESGPIGLHPEAARNLEEGLAISAARLFADRDRTASPRGRLSFERARVVSEVEEFLASAGSEPVYVTDLCERLRLSERTLRYIFEEQFGASPIRVLRSRRLCEVRRALRSAPPGTRVSAVAGRFGFWHLGQFATDYRKLFGERPSETLRHARAAGAPGDVPERRGLAGWAETSDRLA